MKNNKGFAPITIILVIIVLVVGGISYYTGKSSNISLQKVEENNLPKENQNNQIINNQLPKQTSYKEYKNTEAGFSFKYPAEYGEVTMTKDSPDDIGYIYQGRVGIPGEYYFYFTFATKDFEVGDSNPDDPKFDPCKSTEVSCEPIFSKDGSKLQLVKMLDSRAKEPYSFSADFLDNSNYKSVTFVSSDRLTLLNIASQLEIF